MNAEHKLSQAKLHDHVAKALKTRGNANTGVELLCLVTQADLEIRDTERKLLELVDVLNNEAEKLSALVAILFSLAAKAGVVSADRLGELLKTDPAEILATADKIEPAETLDLTKVA